MILASPAIQTHSVIQKVEFLNQTPFSFNLPVGHTGYSSVGSAWGFTPMLHSNGHLHNVKQCSAGFI